MAYDDGLFGNEYEIVKQRALNLTKIDFEHYYKENIDIEKFTKVLDKSKGCDQDKYDGIIDEFIELVEAYRIYVYVPSIIVIIENDIYDKVFMDRLSERMYNEKHKGTKFSKMRLYFRYKDKAGIYWCPQQRGYHLEFIDGKYIEIKNIQTKTWDEIGKDIENRMKGIIDGVQYTMADFNRVID